MTNKHPFHIVEQRPWPIISSINVFNIIYLSLTYWKITNIINIIFINISIIILLSTAILWWRDIIRERSYQGNHTYKVYSGIKISIVSFISTEIIFFFSLFWSLFYFRLSPEIEIRNSWPPIFISPVNPFHIPLINRIILITSGSFVTWSHFCIINRRYSNSIKSLLATITLGWIFRVLQIYEYFNTQFSLNDNVYGSVFYILTGFHGFHVIVGTLFLIINFIRLWKREINTNHHFSLEAAAWYWHFVDVVWIYLYLFLYWWWF